MKHIWIDDSGKTMAKQKPKKIWINGPIIQTNNSGDMGRINYSGPAIMSSRIRGGTTTAAIYRILTFPIEATREDGENVGKQLVVYEWDISRMNYEEME